MKQYYIWCRRCGFGSGQTIEAPTEQQAIQIYSRYQCKHNPKEIICIDGVNAKLTL